MSGDPRAAARCALPGTPLAALQPALDTCVHCGFCLQSCPTYLALDDENDSPRGRIVLMRSMLEGTLPADDPSIHAHIDRCLGCRACETACPSGVPYGLLLEATRATLVQQRPIPLFVRMILSIFSRPVLLRGMMLAARAARGAGIASLLGRMPGRLGFAMAMLASTRPPLKQHEYPINQSGERGRVALLTGCVMDGLFAGTHRATLRTLAMNGYSSVAVAGQRCCGALHAHAGDLAGARALARANVSAFDRPEVDQIVVNAAGCGAMMKDYGHLLADDPAWHERAARVAGRVRDVSELLGSAGPRRAGRVPARVAYDAPCHLVHAQRVAGPPLAVLQAIDGLELVPLPGSEQCCGGAGIYNLVEPEISVRVLTPKLQEIERSGAALVATGNPGCLMQIGAGLLRAGSTVRVVHPVDLLDAAYAAQMSGPS